MIAMCPALPPSRAACGGAQGLTINECEKSSASVQGFATNRFKTAILATGLSALASAQSSSRNLSSLLSSNGELSGLAQLLNSYPNISSTLTGLSNVTIFAPNNQAINNLQRAGTFNTASASEIANLLNYHVVPGKVYSSNITTTPMFAHTMLNSTMYSNVTGGQVVEAQRVNDNVVLTSGYKLESTVTDANLNFSGGVVHIIDRVLTIPPNLLEITEASNLTALLGAVIASNLTTTLADAPDLTIFGPTNNAFAAIASAAGNLSTQQLTSILEYHVLNGTVAYSSSLGNGSVTALDGKNLNITVEDDAIFVNSARVVLADVLYSNGVIQVIDAVLNPANATSPDASVTSGVAQFSGASSGSAVPFTSEVTVTVTTTYSGLTATTDNVANGYSTRTGGGAVGTGAAGTSRGSSSSSGVAAMPTGAVGAAALFGGAALVANW